MDNGPKGRHFNVPLVTMILRKGLFNLGWPLAPRFGSLGSAGPGFFLGSLWSGGCAYVVEGGGTLSEHPTTGPCQAKVMLRLQRES